MPLNEWIVLSRRTLFSGGPIREIAIEAIELPDGRVVPDYYSIRLPDFVLIFAQMTDGTVPMFRHYRHGPRRVCLTFPGGAIEHQETPLDAARRELTEELGCESDRWTTLGSFTTNANQGCNCVHMFRAEGCVRTATPDSGDLEDGEVVWLRPEQLVSQERVEEIGLTSHVALLMLATHPLLQPNEPTGLR